MKKVNWLKRDNIKLAWVILCVAITITSGTIYWQQHQPGDGASFKQLLNAVFSTVAVIGCTAAILLCISVFSSIISKVDNWGEHE